jgi:4-amino-4-deoxy-L-arabinose transferase-like glycosyltransferase
MTMRRAAAVALAVAVAAPLWLVDLDGAGFDDPGEGMHAEIAREWLAAGDPLVLTLNGVRYVDKPPLLYWLQGAVFAVAGLSEGAARVVPAVAALAAVAATAWLGGRLLGAVGGALAGLALLTSTLFFVFGRYVRPETLFVAALAGGFALALAGLAESRPRWVSLGVVVFGLAGLAKDPLGLVMPLVAIAIALALGGQLRAVAVPWGALGVALVLGVGWWLLAEARTPGALWYTVVDNKIRNVAGARLFPDEDVPLGALEFLAVALLGGLPWSLAAGFAVAGLVRRRAWRDPAEAPWVALALWATGLLALTALSRFRLPHYGLPAYPALALLAARAWATGRPSRLAAGHAALFALLAAACLAAWASDGAGFSALVADATDVASRKSHAAGAASPFPPWAALRPLVGHASLAFAAGTAGMLGVLGWCALRRREPAAPDGPRALGMAVAALAMLAVLPAAGSAIALVSDHRSARPVGAILAREARATDLVVHEGPIEATGALEWYGGRRPVIVDGRRSVLAFGATRDDARDVFWDPGRLRAAWDAPGARLWVVSVRPPDRSLVAALAGARLVLAGGGRWLYASPAIEAR